MIAPKGNKFKIGKTSNLYSNKEKPYRRGSWNIAKDLPSSFKYAFQGLSYAFFSQRNFRIHVFIGFLVILLSIWLGLSFSNFAILVLIIATVLVLELINTSLEAVVDLAIGQQFHPIARIAKDCAAASVLVGALSSLIIALLILLPPTLQKLGITTS